MGKKKRVREAPESLGLPRVGVDSHAHLDVDRMRDDLDAVLARAAACGVARIGNVFLGPAAYHAFRELFAARPEVFFLLGVHPHEAAELTAEQIRDMDQAFAEDPRLRAVGEIGLDFYYEYSPREVQAAAFKAQLDLALQRDLPVVIHSREATPETVAVLLDRGFRNRPVLWHCFGEGPDRAEELLGYGWQLSLPGTVTYGKNDPLRAAAAVIPLDRMLLETDCPYLSPEPYRGRRNEPAYTVFTARAVAELRGCDVTEVWERCGRNAVRFFGLNE
jgi:TatD DNase family protein